jgi:hypothetical protein
MAAQIGHEDAALTLRVYTHAVKRLLGDELQEFSRALEWGPRTKKPAISSGLLRWAVLGSNQ